MVADDTLADLGFVQGLSVDADDVILRGGAGTDADIKTHIKTLKEHKAIEPTDMLKKKIDQRIASMSSSIGVIKVGGKSDVERLYLKRKIEDAQYATRRAYQEGVVEGGGQALMKIGKTMKDSVLGEALKAPYEQIQTNGGGKLTIPKTVIDPVKVIRCQVENASSVAGMLLTTGSFVVDKRERTEYEGLELLAKALKKNG